MIIKKNLITSPRLQNTAVLLKKKIYFELSSHRTFQLTTHIIFLWLAIRFGMQVEVLLSMQKTPRCSGCLEGCLSAHTSIYARIS